MENIIGIAISYLQEKGIDTSNLSLEEIIAKYNELLAEEGVSEEAEKQEEVPEAKEEAKEEVAEEEPKEEEPVEEKSELDIILDEYAGIIEGLSDEQKELFDKLINLVK